MIPFLVPKIMYPGSSSDLTLITAANFSPSSNFNKLTIGNPLEIRLAAGIWKAFNKYTLPKLLKNNKLSCVDV